MEESDVVTDRNHRKASVVIELRGQWSLATTALTKLGELFWAIENFHVVTYDPPQWRALLL